MKKILVGIDVGTTGLKVSLFSESGEKLGFAYRSYDLQYPSKNQVVINPNVWWEKLQDCFQELKNQISLSDVEGIGISCANALILVDVQMQPLFPAIMQLDKRGVTMVPRITEELGNKKVFEITGNRIAAGFFWGATLKWLAKNEQEKYLKVRYVFNPASYLVMKLTGAYCMDHTRAITTMLYNIQTGKWDEELCNYFEIPIANMPKLMPSHEIAGKTKAFLEMGISKGIPVTPGIMDTVSAQVGLTHGISDNVLIMGSVGRFCIFTHKIDPRFMNCVSYNREKLVNISPVNNCGFALKWIRKVLFPNESQIEKIYDYMDELAEKASIGSDGLLFFPYLTGCTSPHWNESIRGSFIGLGIQHQQPHFIRAVMEGVGFSLGENLRIIEHEIGIPIESLYVGGGGAKSKVWMQIMSNILGKELIIPTELETETMGAAIMAGIGTGIIKNINEEARSWNLPLKTIPPNQDQHLKYRKIQDVYIDLYAGLAEQQRMMDISFSDKS